MTEYELRFIKMIVEYYKDPDSFVYIPVVDIRAHWKNSELKLLRRLLRKYKAWKETIVGVSHWVINPLVEVDVDITTAEIIRRITPSYFELKDEDIPF